MVTSNEELQVKELLQRVNIRTMKKDLKQLREADSLTERQKISSIDATPTELIPPVIEEVIPSIQTPPAAPKAMEDIQIPPPKIPVPPAPREEEKPFQPLQDNQAKILSKTPNVIGAGEFKTPPQNPPIIKAPSPQNTPVSDTEIKLKKFANEYEKQQIFLLESQKTDLENQAKGAMGAKEPSFNLEKNEILLKQKDQQRKLEVVVQEEKKNEAEQAVSQGKEALSDTPSEKQQREEETSALEEKNQQIEKKRWSIESELAGLEKRLKNLDSSDQETIQRQDTLTSEMAKINNSLKNIYSRILAREETKAKQLQERQKMEAGKKVQIQKEVPARPSIMAPKNEEKNYLKGVPEAAKEKLAQSAKAENIQRKKFMEDVEKWASENNTNA